MELNEARERISRLESDLRVAYREIEKTSSEFQQLALELEHRVAHRTEAVRQSEAELRGQRDHLQELVSDKGREVDRLRAQLKERDNELRSSEERFRSLVLTIPDIVYRIDREGCFTFISEAVKRLGYEPGELLGKHFSTIVNPGDTPGITRETVLPRWKGKITGDREAPKLFDERRTGPRKTAGLEVRILTKQGGMAPGIVEPIGDDCVVVEINSSGLYGIHEGGTRHDVFVGSVGVIRDISDRKRDQAKILKQGKLHAAINQVFLEALRCDSEEEVASVCLEAASRLTESPLGMVLEGGVSGGTFVAKATKDDARGAAAKEIFSQKSRGPLREWFKEISRKGTGAVLNDISAGEMGDSETGERAGLVRTLTVPVKRGDEMIGMIILANKAGEYSQDDINAVETLSLAYREALLRKRSELEVKQHREHLEEMVEQRTRELRESQAKYRLLVEMASEAVYVVQDSRIKFHNKEAERMTGYTAMELRDMPAETLVHPEDREWALKRYEARMRGENPTSSYELRLIHKNGQEIFAHIEVVVIEWEGKPASLNFIRNITTEKEMESQVRQLQKMEALGRLAGGVAHDFNNLLTTIIGNAQLALADLPKGDPLRVDVEEIKRAGDRGASLTRQLLAFSRKQMVEPIVLDLNDLLRNLEKMLRRMIGEDVRLEMRLASHLSNIKADAGQMEQVFMNLAVNARDAMPNGGELYIQTENVYLDGTCSMRGVSVAPGHYVLASVSDTGAGMNEWVRSHLFEPFFTTKDIGKGTGLGLSTVYGIVKQAGGHIQVTSEPGKGAAFEIYLPRAAEGSETAEGLKMTVETLAGTETILVLEDDASIRETARRALEVYGYSVLAASNGEEALTCVEQSKCSVHLALVDVVLPGIDGLEAATRLSALSPALKFIFTSGYPEDMIQCYGLLKPGFNFMPKPFTMEDLVRRVRAILNER